MSILEEVPPQQLPADTAGTEQPWVTRMDAGLTWLGERLNPILVKEARQALKSRQFVLTFSLLLAASWFWSIFGLLISGPSAYYTPIGPMMLYGYFVVLSFPLLVVVPFSAFRSLAAEIEDRTYELVSITILGPRQIISGKLAAAALQMLVYLSAIMPCLAFTYLLRGTDLPTIVWLLVYTVLGSMGLSVIGLLLSSATTERYQQTILSVMLLCGILFVFWMALIIASQIVYRNALNSSDMPIVNACLLTFYFTSFAIVYLAASAQLMPISWNRSTALRVGMVVQHVCIMGWFGWGWFVGRTDEDILEAFLCVSLAYWSFMGSLMVGETAALSPRVKRDLPQTFLGRVLLTWFNPGPGTGFIFAVTNLAAAVGLVLLAVPARAFFESAYSGNQLGAIVRMAVLVLAYLIIYLGLGKMLLAPIRRRLPLSMFLRVSIVGLLVGIGTAVPLLVQLSTDPNAGYSLLQITNPFWTLEQATHNSPGPDAITVSVVLPIAALLMLLASLPEIAAEVQQVRIAKPARVAEEDAQLEAAAHPIVHVPTSPWDE